MLDLHHFVHLPELAAIVSEIEAEQAGMVVVAGLDPRSGADSESSLLPGGRAAFFRIILRRLWPADPRKRVLIITNAPDIFHAPRDRRRQLTTIRPDEQRAAPIGGLRPALMVFDRLDADTVAAAVGAAQAGVRVIAQIDTIFRGRDVLRVLDEMGAPPEALGSIRWVIAAQRWAALCPVCRTVTRDTALRSAIIQRLGAYDGPLYVSGGCPACEGAGRQGEVTVFDVYRQRPDGTAETALPLERYLLGLVADGRISPHDLLDIEGEQLRRTYRLLTAHERAQNTANVELQRKLVELEAAQRVLEQRNRALLLLEETSRALLTTVTLRDLGAQICRNARELARADRAILYCLCDPNSLDVVAADGWDPSRLPQAVDPAALELDATADATARPYHKWPPGIPYRRPDIEGAQLKAGLWVPLVAQGENVGVMVVHSTHRNAFSPSEATVLEAFAGQAALAVQRTRLIEQLQEKIDALEAAQEGLAAKERMERELELARQVQQNMLPRTFPAIPGYRFAARNAPAREVGGDLYDVFSLENGRFGIVIADVSDKGIAAALYMAVARSLILAEARREASPQAVLGHVNRLLREVGDPEMFVTVFYGVIDGATHRLVYARAGHDRPVLIRRGESIELGGRGNPLGIFDPDAFHLTEEETALSHGDRLVLYTDGLTDLITGEGDAFGIERLTALWTGHAHEPTDRFVASVFEALRDCCSVEEQFDDMTMLVVDLERP